jgi:hypothetical protein
MDYGHILKRCLVACLLGLGGRLRLEVLLGFLDDVALLAMVLRTLGALEVGVLIGGLHARGLGALATSIALGAQSLGGDCVGGLALLAINQLVTLLADNGGLGILVCKANVVLLVELEALGANPLGLVDLVLTGNCIAGLDAPILGEVIVLGAGRSGGNRFDGLALLSVLVSTLGANGSGLLSDLLHA